MRAKALEWWLWVLLGLFLVGLEVFTPGGFYLLFFGIAALLVGGLASTYLAGPLWTQILLFTAIAVAGILMFRRALVGRFGTGSRGAEMDTLVGETATALEDLAPGALGRVELRGAAWNARNSGGVPVQRGHRCTVERVEGLTVWVRIAADEYLSATGHQSPTAALSDTPGGNGAGSAPQKGTAETPL
jgi:inner membrane protein